MLSFNSDAGRRIAFERRSALAGSILLHLLLLAWLLTASHDPADPQRDRPPRTFDLPPVLPDTVELVKPPAVAEPDRAASAEGGGGGGKPATALITRPGVRPAPRDVPIPAVPLMLPDTVPLAIAPVAALALINRGGEGSGRDTGTGAGEGSGSGNGTGSGTGAGSGAGSGTGGQGRNAGPLQPAEWIVRPSDEVMQAAFPRRAALDKISGNVRLSCLIDRKQRARACRVLEEKPANYGFAKAAKEAVGEGRIKAPIVKDQDPTKVRVGVVIAFDYD